jgi:hypothetical protein
MTKRCVLGRIVGVGEVVLLGLWCEGTVATFLIAIATKETFTKHWTPPTVDDDSWFTTYGPQEKFLDGLETGVDVIGWCRDSFEPVGLQNTKGRFLAKLRLGYTCRITYDEDQGTIVAFAKDGEEEIVQEPMQALVTSYDLFKEKYLAKHGFLGDDGGRLATEVDTYQDGS